MVVGDEQPFIAALITLDDEALPDVDGPARQAAGTSRRPTWPTTRTCIADMQAAVDDANTAVSQAESIQKFRVLAADFTEASGHLTPSLKVKRGVGDRRTSPTRSRRCTPGRRRRHIDTGQA